VIEAQGVEQGSAGGGAYQLDGANLVVAAPRLSGGYARHVERERRTDPHGVGDAGVWLRGRGAGGPREARRVTGEAPGDGRRSIVYDDQRGR
jgi:hypothetical protein